MRFIKFNKHVRPGPIVGSLPPTSTHTNALAILGWISFHYWVLGILLDLTVQMNMSEFSNSKAVIWLFIIM